MGLPQKLHTIENSINSGGGVVLDVAYLNRATFGDIPLRSEIIALFRSEVSGLSRRLDLPMDHQTWQFLTHTLKGAAAAVGALSIAEMASAWEQLPHPSTGDARCALSADLKTAVLAFERAASKLH